MTPAERIAAEALAEIEREGRPADRVLRRTLRAHGELDGDGRRRVAQLVLGVRCHRRRLDYLLQSLGVDGARRFEVFDRDRRGEDLGIVWPEDPVERIATEWSLPSFVAEAFVRELGDRAADVAATLTTPGPIAIRTNTLRTSRERLEARLEAEGMVVRPGRLAPNALRLEHPRAERGEKPDIRGSPAWRDGDFEVQDEASQMVAVAVGARAGETVVDLCAGAGGKTLAIAATMADRGTLLAADVDPDRLHDLATRLERVPLTSVRVVDLRTRTGSIEDGLADRVLVDAPCSAVGTWRRGPDRKWHLSPADVERFARVQAELLERAAALARPGGRVVYATCTLLDRENREVVEQAPGCLKPVPVWEGAASSVTLLPPDHDTDGFFISAFERS